MRVKPFSAYISSGIYQMRFSCIRNTPGFRPGQMALYVLPDQFLRTSRPSPKGGVRHRLSVFSSHLWQAVLLVSLGFTCPCNSAACGPWMKVLPGRHRLRICPLNGSVQSLLLRGWTCSAVRPLFRLPALRPAALWLR